MKITLEQRHRDRLLHDPIWNTLQSDSEPVLTIMVGTVFQPLGHMSFHEIIQTTFLAYKNSMQSSVESPTKVRIYQIFCLLLCCYPVILWKKEIRLMWSLIDKSMLAISFTLLSSWCFQLDCLIICWCVILAVFNWAIVPRSSSFVFLKTVTVFALLSPLESPPYFTKSWTQSLMVQRLLHIDHYSLVAEYHLAL